MLTDCNFEWYTNIDNILSRDCSTSVENLLFDIYVSMGEYNFMSR